MRNTLSYLEKRNLRFSDKESIKIGEIYVHYLPLIEQKVKRFLYKIRRSTDVDEVVSRCTDRFLTSCKLYDPSKQPFDKYMNVQIKYALCDWMAETSLQRSRVCVVSHIDYTEYCDSKKSDIDKFIEREDKKTMFTGDAKEVYEFLISQNAVHKRWKTCVKSFVRMKLTSGWSRKKISAAFNELVNVMKEYCKE